MCIPIHLLNAVIAKEKMQLEKLPCWSPVLSKQMELCAVLQKHTEASTIIIIIQESSRNSKMKDLSPSFLNRARSKSILLRGGIIGSGTRLGHEIGKWLKKQMKIE